MSVSVTMPRLGESVSEGTVTRWLKKEGDHVEADEPLLEVSTDKVDTEIPSPAAGVLTSIKVAEDETVEVGSELAVIDEGGGDGGGSESDSAEKEDSEPQDEAADEPEQKDDEKAESEPEQESDPAQDSDEQEQKSESKPEAEQEQEDSEPESEKEAEPQQQKAQASEPRADEDGDGDGGDASYVTPLVRRLAAEHGVELSNVHGTGVGGRIRKQDVLDAAKSSGGGEAPAKEQKQQPSAPERQPAAAASAPSTPDTSLRGRTEKLSRLRTVIAQRMVESLQISAQLTTVVEADITKISRLRDRAKGEFEAREGVKLSFLPFFALATCEALREHPAVNSSIDVEAGTATYHDAVHLGVAVDTPKGLLVPVVKDASDLNLAGLARKIADLADRTRGNHITPDELGGGTFTLTNTGSRGALFDTPIINQPQVGILGTGSVVKRAVVVDDPDVGEVIAVRHMVYLALTYDHRMVDGADAARFLTTVKSRLEEGEFEAEVGL
jgi:2-oxoglutarate dehydrogenase E2 component (dihydrolipoamide succinyltransferase)